MTVRNSLDEEEHISFDQMLVGLLTGESKYDLFFLRYAGGQAATLVKRGYLADLKQSEILRPMVLQMPPAIQARIMTADGGIFAFPCTLSPINHLMGFNTAVAAELGIQKPKTYAEFFDILARWDTGYEAIAAQKEMYLYDRAVWTPHSFLSEMLNAYIAGYAEDGAIDYDTPVFEALMGLLDEHRALLSDLRAKTRVMQKGQPWKYVLFITDCPMLMDSDTEESYGGVIEPMPLSITDHPADAVLPIDMSAFSVYADSPDRALSMRYIECCAAAFSPDVRILFEGGSDDTPVERADYEDAIAYYEMIIPAMEKRIAEKGETEELAEELAMYRREMEDYIARRYAYTSESIRRYAALADSLRPMPSVSYDYYADQPNTEYLLDSFEKGELPPAKFIRDFNHVQTMMNLEAQY